MEKQLGPLVVDCDAPPYWIVQATAAAGIDRPEDVRWVRLSHHFLDWEARNLGGLAFYWHGKRSPRDSGPTCVCGQPLPALLDERFVFDTGVTVPLFVGQCSHCHTVFWDEG